MDLKKVLLLLIVAFLAYKFLYKEPEVDYGQFAGKEQRAPRLSGTEVVGHLLIYLPSRSYAAGHGFVLSHNSQDYVVSASHVVNDFKSVDSVDVVAGTRTVISDATPALGPAYSTCTMEDAGRDVTFYSTSAAPIGGELSLAAAPPQAGQNVWLLCTQDGQGDRQLLVPAKVTSSTNRALKYEFSSPVAFNGTSGCPIVDSNKRLVGVNVCGHATVGVAVPIPTVLEGLSSI